MPVFGDRGGQVAPKIALEKLAKGEKVPKEFLDLAAKELKAASSFLDDIFVNKSAGC